mgnify:CR=1 FL=1
MRSFKSDVLLNVGLTFVSLLGTMWLLWLASRALDPAALGLFLLIRRLADTVSQLMHLGAPIAIRRYLTVSSQAHDRAGHFFAALVLAIVGIGVWATVLLAFPRTAMKLLGETEGSDPQTMICTVLLSGALVFHYLANSSLLSRRRVVAANVLELTNVAAIPIAVLYLTDSITPQHLITIQAVGVTALSFAVLTAIVFSARGAVDSPTRPLSFEYLRETATYGLPRAVSLILESGFLVIGPWLLRDDLAAVAYLTIAFFLLRLARIAAQPVAILIGMKLGALHSLGQRNDVRRGLDLITGGALLSAAIIVPVVHCWSALILQLWVGDSLAASVQPYVNVLLLAIAPLALLQTLKEPIEIMWKSPYILGAFTLGNALLLAIGALLRPAAGASDAVTWAYVIAYFAMCTCALAVVRKYLSDLWQFGLFRLAGLATLSYVVNAIAVHATESSSIWWRVAGMVSVGSLSAAVVVAGYLWASPSPVAATLRDYLMEGFLSLHRRLVSTSR